MKQIANNWSELNVVANRNCSECGAEFDVTEWEKNFRDQLQVPLPKRCRDCRARLRLSHLNQTQLFKIQSAITGKSLITHYPPSVVFPVVEQDFWHSENFDASKFAREYDPSRSFFEQFGELSSVVPRPNLATVFSRVENSPYANFTGAVKNCYLVFNSNELHDCYYCYGVNNSRDSFDCYSSINQELCYENIVSSRCYNSAFLYNSIGCRDSAFLSNCIGCSNCLLCSNLRHKENYLRNKPASKEQIALARKQLVEKSWLEQMKREFREIISRYPQKGLMDLKSENCLGNHLVNCKNAFYCFYCVDLESGMYCSQGFAHAKDCLDCDEVGGGELLFESANSGIDCYHLRYCFLCDAGCKYLTYCDFCTQGTADCFGCIGLKRKRYCILNKQYSKSEYYQLVERIVQSMANDGSWGEFFPAYLSPFPFYITQASKHYPLSKNVASARGYNWYDLGQAESNYFDYPKVPGRLSELRQDALSKAWACQECGKGYKILPKELEILNQLQLAPPESCFNCRHARRVAANPARSIIAANCASCGTEILASYGPPTWQNIYCSSCAENSYD